MQVSGRSRICFEDMVRLDSALFAVLVAVVGPQDPSRYSTCGPNG